jgi:hypothetical protein
MPSDLHYVRRGFRFNLGVNIAPKVLGDPNELENSEDCRSAGGHGNQYVRLRGPQIDSLRRSARLRQRSAASSRGRPRVRFTTSQITTSQSCCSTETRRPKSRSRAPPVVAMRCQERQRASGFFGPQTARRRCRRRSDRSSMTASLVLPRTRGSNASPRLAGLC